MKERESIGFSRDTNFSFVTAGRSKKVIGGGFDTRDLKLLSLELKNPGKKGSEPNTFRDTCIVKRQFRIDPLEWYRIWCRDGKRDLCLELGADQLVRVVDGKNDNFTRHWWKPARELEMNDYLFYRRPEEERLPLSVIGEGVMDSVVVVDVEPIPSSETMVQFAVEKHHCFFANGILVAAEGAHSLLSKKGTDDRAK